MSDRRSLFTVLATDLLLIDVLTGRSVLRLECEVSRFLGNESLPVQSGRMQLSCMSCVGKKWFCEYLSGQ